jgi:hypothetical protein
MPEIGTSGSMSGDGKRGVGHRPQAAAPILDSTRSKPAISSSVSRWQLRSNKQIFPDLAVRSHLGQEQTSFGFHCCDRLQSMTPASGPGSELMESPKGTFFPVLETLDPAPIGTVWDAVDGQVR